MAKHKSKGMVIAKTLSWAAVSGAIIFTTALVETGMWKAAFVTALVSALLKTPVYSIHEVLWNRRDQTEPKKAERPTRFPLKMVG